MNAAVQVTPAIFDAVVSAKIKSGRPFVLLQPEVIQREGAQHWMADGQFDINIKGIVDDAQSTEALVYFLRCVADTIEDGLYER